MYRSKCTIIDWYHVYPVTFPLPLTSVHTLSLSGLGSAFHTVPSLHLPLQIIRPSQFQWMSRLLSLLRRSAVSRGSCWLLVGSSPPRRVSSHWPPKLWRYTFSCPSSPFLLLQPCPSVFVWFQKTRSFSFWQCQVWFRCACVTWSLVKSNKFCVSHDEVEHVANYVCCRVWW